MGGFTPLKLAKTINQGPFLFFFFNNCLTFINTFTCKCDGGFGGSNQALSVFCSMSYRFALCIYLLN